MCPLCCSDAHALLSHQKGEVEAELESLREQLSTTQDSLAAAEVRLGRGRGLELWVARNACSVPEHFPLLLHLTLHLPAPPTTSITTSGTPACD